MKKPISSLFGGKGTLTGRETPDAGLSGAMGAPMRYYSQGAWNRGIQAGPNIQNMVGRLQEHGVRAHYRSDGKIWVEDVYTLQGPGGPQIGTRFHTIEPDWSAIRAYLGY